MSAGILENDVGIVWGTTWHGIPSYVTQDEPVKVIEARKILNYPLEKKPLFLTDGRAVKAWAIVREDTKDIVCDSVGPDYTVMNNSVMLGFIEEHLLSKYPDLQIESVGTLFNGATAFVNLKLNEFTVTGDKSPTVNRLMYCNPIGRGSYKACAHSIRIVCNNTLRASEAQGAANDTLKRIPHTLNAVNRLKDHLIDLAEVRLGLKEYEKNLEVLTGMPVDTEYVNEFVADIFPSIETSTRSVSLSDTKKNRFLDIFEGNQDLSPEVAKVGMACYRL